MRDRRPRKYISIRERWAGALKLLLPEDLRAELVEKRAPARTVIAMFEDDHTVLHALGGEDRWWNLTPMLKAEHREKSRKDTSIVSKVDRLSAAHQDFRDRVLAIEKKPKPPSRWAKRPFHRGG